MDYQQTGKLLSEIEQVVTAMFAQYTPAYLVYHNINHTRAVVARTLEIANHYQLAEEDRIVLMAAAWFHDTGQLFATPERHEEQSVIVANIFFHDLASVPADLLTAIGHCILATRMPQRPYTLIEAILCDADLYHLGTDEFMSIDNLVKEEFRLRGISVAHWDQGTINLMHEHHFHTTYCKEKLTSGKKRNLLLLKAALG